MARLSLRKLSVFCLCISAFIFLVITFQVAEELGQFDDPVHRWEAQGTSDLLTDEKIARSSEGHYPVIVWWSPLIGEQGRLGECGRNRCFFTVNRSYYALPSTHAFLFYGTDLNIESLPLPRQEHHHWALFHEESPKNNYKLFHEPVITLFNHTATFSQHSHLPLVTQHLQSLDSLTSHIHLVPLAQKNHLRARVLAPVVYVQSDCDPPSDRDVYVAKLMRYIPVDSYGQCLHNRDLPAHLQESTAMDEQGFYDILARYKFILAFENAICDDYITEKLWRPLKLGVVPVYFGAPNVRQWLPSNRSAVVVNPDTPPERLAEYLKRLDENDEEYLTYLEWKRKREVTNEVLVSEMKYRPWGVQDLTQNNYIDVFECMVCDRVWENINRHKQGLQSKTWQAEADHLRCPRPRLFDFDVGPPKGSSLRNIWRPSYDQSVKEAKAMRRLVVKNKNFTVAEFWKEVFSF
ncbi:alpha-(1,3)-fucosyltransferase 10 isoform X1 [Alosa sapidissima]|uniref:alpha-(1,3)-fucosyltransferase 10 isoform X1 n=1 Tax=Alosa sapidissima TaxID=34773 RepID=UPI001C09069F|nr:alpha-(1,3)-fucosyltransferase 10 isoform X1 [Alosa sapidissima]